MKIYFSDFVRHLEKKDLIKFIGSPCTIDELQTIEHKLGKTLPNSFTNMYLTFNGLTVKGINHFEILKLQELTFTPLPLIPFSTMDNNKIICFDTSHINVAGEWDIINAETKFIITHTLGSYLSNKSLAWIERNRNIWEQEIYENYWHYEIMSPLQGLV